MDHFVHIGVEGSGISPHNKGRVHSGVFEQRDLSRTIPRVGKQLASRNHTVIQPGNRCISGRKTTSLLAHLFCKMAIVGMMAFAASAMQEIEQNMDVPPKLRAHIEKIFEIGEVLSRREIPDASDSDEVPEPENEEYAGQNTLDLSKDMCQKIKDVCGISQTLGWDAERLANTFNYMHISVKEVPFGKMLEQEGPDFTVLLEHLLEMKLCWDFNFSLDPWNGDKEENANDVLFLHLCLMNVAAPVSVEYLLGCDRDSLWNRVALGGMSLMECAALNRNPQTALTNIKLLVDAGYDPRQHNSQDLFIQTELTVLEAILQRPEFENREFWKKKVKHYVEDKVNRLALWKAEIKAIKAILQTNHLHVPDHLVPELLSFKLNAFILATLEEMED